MFHEKYGTIKHIHLFFVLLLCCGWASSADAQRVYIDIDKAIFARIPIAIPDLKRETSAEGQLAHEMSDTLGKDLDYSGLFRVLDPAGFMGDPQTMGVAHGEIDFGSWKRLGSEFLVRGSYVIQGSNIQLNMYLYDVVGNRQVLGKAYTGQIRDWKSMIHRFADEIIMALTGERGVFGTKIAFVQVQGQNKEIYMVDFDGSNPVQVTHENSISLSPSWSRDGGLLAYTCFKEDGPKLFVKNVFDGSQRLLAGFPGLNITPAWRPGGSELAATLSKDGNPNIYLVSSSGAVISKLVDSWSIDVSPTWSPDGRQLAYVSSESGSPQIYVLNVASGQKRRLTYKGSYNTSPRWSPKGDWIAYSGASGGRHNLFIISPNGGEGKQLTNGEGNNECPTWSPDGRLLAFSSTREGGPALWTMVVNDQSVRRITRMPGQQILPDWSPRLVGQQ
jgi:TolB protein